MQGDSRSPLLSDGRDRGVRDEDALARRAAAGDTAGGGCGIGKGGRGADHGCRRQRHLAQLRHVWQRQRAARHVVVRLRVLPHTNST